jgi:dTDP-4-dehydrorhamnose reductase
VLNLGAVDAVTKEAFGRMVARAFDLSDASIEGITLGSLGLPAPRPRNTALDVARLARTLGTAPPTVAAGVRALRDGMVAAARLKGRDASSVRALVEDPAS